MNRFCISNFPDFMFEFCGKDYRDRIHRTSNRKEPDLSNWKSSPRLWGYKLKKKKIPDIRVDFSDKALYLHLHGYKKFVWCQKTVNLIIIIRILRQSFELIKLQCAGFMQYARQIIRGNPFTKKIWFEESKCKCTLFNHKSFLCLLTIFLNYSKTMIFPIRGYVPKAVKTGDYTTNGNSKFLTGNSNSLKWCASGKILLLHQCMY